MHSSFHILVVDDDEDMLWCLQNILSRAGNRLTSVLTGEEALHQVGSTPLDLAIVDAKLPDVDGMDMAAEIKRRFPHLPVILISGYFYGDDSTITEALRGKVIDGFIAKPFDVEEVVDAVDKIKRLMMGKMNAEGS
jgi:DNA-binding NtrC family response regulator